jgi:hypothetical protein
VESGRSGLEGCPAVEAAGDGVGSGWASAGMSPAQGGWRRERLAEGAAGQGGGLARAGLAGVDWPRVRLGWNRVRPDWSGLAQGAAWLGHGGN